MDAFVVKRVVAELAESLRGALVSKIHQPAEKVIVLSLWTGRGEKRLLLSAEPEMCRLHLTTRKTHNPPRPPRFCQFLRRHLEGMRIADIRSLPFERSARLDFAASRPDALHPRSMLYAELFGRHANLIYVDEGGTILEALRSVPSEETRIREVGPGLPYVPLPRPGRICLPDVTEADARRIFSRAPEGLDRALLAEVSGIGREVAREAAARGRESAEALYAAIRDLVRRYEADEVAPGIGTLPDGRKRLLPFPCPGAGFTDFTPFATANDAADAYYGEAAAAHEQAVLSQQIRSRIRALLKKERSKLENVGGDEERLEEGLAAGERGEILKANLPSLRRGMTEFRGIPLDPSKSPVENMTRYFQLHKKAMRAVELVRKRKREVAEAVFYLESLEAQLDEAKTRDDLIAVRRELSAAYAEKPTRRRPARRAPDAAAPPAPRVERVEFGGHTILVGRNNAGNDRIVKELAAPEDLWLHAQGIPGAHVLVRRIPGREIPEEVVLEAARLAVFHSKARGSSNVPVFVASARDVTKFKGAKPGLVRIARYKTINVR